MSTLLLSSENENDGFARCGDDDDGEEAACLPPKNLRPRPFVGETAFGESFRFGLVLRKANIMLGKMRIENAIA